MKHFAAATLALLTAGLAFAGTQAQHDAVKALGALNGVALQCGYFDQVSRMKAAVVESAPKERSFGLAFDRSSNDAFLGIIQTHRPCPGPGALEREVDKGIEAMKRAFSAP